jgi:hypothetical protein
MVRILNAFNLLLKQYIDKKLSIAHVCEIEKEIEEGKNGFWLWIANNLLSIINPYHL